MRSHNLCCVDLLFISHGLTANKILPLYFFAKKNTHFTVQIVRDIIIHLCFPPKFCSKLTLLFGMMITYQTSVPLNIFFTF